MYLQNTTKTLFFFGNSRIIKTAKIVSADICIFFPKIGIKKWTCTAGSILYTVGSGSHLTS